MRIKALPLLPRPRPRWLGSALIQGLAVGQLTKDELRWEGRWDERLIGKPLPGTGRLTNAKL
jgi:hypothetical protein